MAFERAKYVAEDWDSQLIQSSEKKFQLIDWYSILSWKIIT